MKKKETVQLMRVYYNLKPSAKKRMRIRFSASSSPEPILRCVVVRVKDNVCHPQGLMSEKGLKRSRLE